MVISVSWATTDDGADTRPRQLSTRTCHWNTCSPHSAVVTSQIHQLLAKYNTKVWGGDSSRQQSLLIITLVLTAVHLKTLIKAYLWRNDCKVASLGVLEEYNDTFECHKKIKKERNKKLWISFTAQLKNQCEKTMYS